MLKRPPGLDTCRISNSSRKSLGKRKRIDSSSGSEEETKTEASKKNEDDRDEDGGQRSSSPVGKVDKPQRKRIIMDDSSDED